MTEPLGLYVHVPFCQTKCGYCDFYSLPTEGQDQAALVDALCKEIEARVSAVGRPPATVFVGGGTPTLLPASLLKKLLAAIRGRVGDSLTEWTVEANPATIDREKTRILREAGVNRVSMGGQSFHEAELATLERIHHPADIPKSIQLLNEEGIGRLNLDLIFGIPGQTRASWAESLRRAVDLGVGHLSCYGLTYEPGTRLTALRDHGRLTPCDEDLEVELFEDAADFLAEQGFEAYEISNYARPGQECRHNLIYWRNQPYIGCGPSAAGRLGDRRYRNVPDVAAYVKWMRERGQAESEAEWLDGDALRLEAVMMQMRLTREGLDGTEFARRFGPLQESLNAEGLEEMEALGLVEWSGRHLRLTRPGRLLANPVIARLALKNDRSGCKEASGSNPTETLASGNMPVSSFRSLTVLGGG